MGVPSSVSAGKLHRCKAPGLECRTSSISGPGRLEAKGTLKDRLTVESVEVGEGIVGGPLMRLNGSWVAGLEAPGFIILSRAPTNPELILCIFGKRTPQHLANNGWAWMRKEGEGRDNEC
jgi:hypothetical protein